MKRVSHYNTAKDKLLHIETDGCVINIQIGLHNSEEEEVISISIYPTTHEGWRLEGICNNRIIKTKEGII